MWPRHWTGRTSEALQLLEHQAPHALRVVCHIYRDRQDLDINILVGTLHRDAIEDFHLK